MIKDSIFIVIPILLKQNKSDLSTFSLLFILISLILIDFTKFFWKLKHNLCEISDDCLNNTNIYRNITYDFLKLLLIISFHLWDYGEYVGI